MTRRKAILPLAALLSVALAAGNVWAGEIHIGVGGAPPNGPFVADDNGGIHVGTETEPIPIYIDPHGDPWLKQFEIPAGTAIYPGDVFEVWENITILPPPTGVPLLPLTDWHEEIHDSDLPFAWGGGHLVIHDLPDRPDIIGEVSADGRKIWFDPIPPTLLPVDIWIHKQLVYTGDVDILPDHNPIYINVWEHPTVPEPSTVALALLGGMGLIGLARRRRFKA